MKRILLLIIAAITLVGSGQAQTDTLYIHHEGDVIFKRAVNQIDSITFCVDTVTSFRCGDLFVDIRDGKEYPTVQIGNQCWMAKNMAYLPAVFGPGAGSQSDPYNYVYGYEGTDISEAIATAHYTDYGVLYNWTSAMAGSASSSLNPSGIQGICPAGWHLPSDAEWTQLTDFLGGESNAAGKLKETGTAAWSAPNTGATNESGFTGLPGGNRRADGSFFSMGEIGYWWSATQLSATHARSRTLNYNSNSVSRLNNAKELGFSVRCVLD